MAKRRRKSQSYGGCGAFIGCAALIVVLVALGAALVAFGPYLCGAGVIVWVVAWILSPLFAPGGRR